MSAKMQMVTILAVALALVLVLPLHAWDPNNQELELVFIDVGHGDSTIVKCPNGQIAVVDMGSTKDRSVAKGNIELELEEAFKERGKRKIDLLVLTHADIDHYNRVRPLLLNHAAPFLDTEVGEVWYVGSQANGYEDKGALLTALKEKRAVLRPLTTGSDPPGHKSFDCGPGARFTIVVADAPTSGTEDTNTGSIVIRVSYRGQSALLMADATQETARFIHQHTKWGQPVVRSNPDSDLISAAYLTESYYRYIPNKGMLSAKWLQSGLLRVPHHGSESAATCAGETLNFPCSEWFLKAVIQPEIMFISTGAHEAHGLPRCSVLKVLEKARDIFLLGDAPEHLIDCCNEVEDHRCVHWDQHRTNSRMFSTLKERNVQGVSWRWRVNADGSVG